MLTFKLPYFICSILLFIIEVLIALYVHDDIIRPHIGDVLVVILIYCFLKAFLNISVRVAAIITLLFSYVIEALQYFKIVEVLGLEKSELARVVIGTHFTWIDIICYTAGIIIVLLAEWIIVRKTTL